MDLAGYYKENIANNALRKKAKRAALNELSDWFFTYFTAFSVAILFVCGVYAVFGFVSMLFLARGCDLRYALGCVYVFLCFPVLKGACQFCLFFISSRKRDFSLIFSFFCSKEAFKAALRHTLFSAVSFGICLFPFALCVEIPYLAELSGFQTAVLEAVSLFLALGGIVTWLSLTCRGRANRKDTGFFLSFLLHFALIFLTYGLWLLWLMPYSVVSYIFFTLCKEETTA